MLFVNVRGMCRRLARYVMALFLASVTGCAATPAVVDEQWSIATSPPISEYVLRAGDIIALQLFYNPEINETVVIRPDGMISMQLIDEVKASGFSPSELDEIITAKFSEILEQPDVSVIVRQMSAQHVYVGGEVLQPGLIPLSSGLSCLQAIFRSGGYKATAKTSSVVVLRNQGTLEPQIVILDLSKELRPNGTHNDVLLSPQDIVYVPRSLIAEIGLFVEQYIENLIPIQFTMGLSYAFTRGTSEVTSEVTTTVVQ